MKKYALSIALLLLLVLSLGACTQEHQHTYQTDYTSNDDRHWRESFCGHGTLDDAEHSFDGGIVLTPATCSERGIMYYSCTVCGHKKQEAIDCLPHELSHFEAKAPICTEAGWEAYDACKNCDYSTKSERYDLSAHSWVATDYRTEPTCQYKGSQEYRCTYCTRTKSEDLPLANCSFAYDQGPFQHIMQCQYCHTSQGGYERHTPDTTNTCTVCAYQISCEGMTFELSEDGTYYTLTNGGNVRHRYQSDSGHLVVPPYYNGLPVKVIGERAMAASFARNVGAVYMFDHVEVIGRYAFADTMIGQLYLPATLKRIDEDAFEIGAFVSGGPTSIGVYFGGTLEGWLALELATLYSNPMKGCGVGSLTLENGPSLSHLSIPAGTTEIKPFLFAGCRSIKTITLPEGLLHIGESAFDFTTPTATYANMYYLYRSPCREIVIPDSVKTIGANAFCGMSLLSVTLGRGLTSVGNQAFGGCRNLVELNNLSALSASSLLGNAVHKDSLLAVNTERPQTSRFYTDELGFVFYEAQDGLYLVYLEDGGSASMEELTLPAPHGDHESYAIHTYALYQRDFKNLTIPDCVTRIGERAFTSCPRLARLTVGNGVTEIGDYAFYSCGTMASYTVEMHVTLGAKVQVLGDHAFGACSNMLSFEMPDTVISIGKYCFRFCSQLRELRLSTALEVIGEGAFDNCYALEGLVIPAGVTALKNCFNYCNLSWLLLQGTPSELCVTSSFSTEGALHLYLSCDTIPASWGENWNAEGFPFHLADEWQLEGGIPAPL